jgi:hypothetical protein
MRSKNLELNQALAFDKLEEFVRQEEARGAELVRGSDFERALALLTVQRQTRSRIYSPNSKPRIGSHPFNGTL